MTDASARRTPFDPVERETWEERVRHDLGEGLEGLWRGLLDGVEVKPLYTERVLDPGEPGAPPFVRGSLPKADWRICHALTGHDAESIAASAAAAQAGEAERLWLPTEGLYGLGDEDGLRAALGETSLPIDVEVDPLGLAWVGAFDRLDARIEPVCDPLAHLARGELPIPLDEAARLLAAIVSSAEDDARPALVDARVHHEAGAGAALELGAAVATGLAHLRALSEHGHPLADAPRRMRFAFAVGSDLFVGVAKLRAARLLWSKVLRAIGIDGAEQGMRVHAFASRRERTTHAHHNNLLRETVAAFAAIVGGADRITLEPYAATPHGERLSRNTQLLLRHESHLDRVTDAAGGSYYVEALTDELARAGWTWLQDIEGQGGMTTALSDGWLGAEVQIAAERRRVSVRHAWVPLVGVNRYPAPATTPAPPAEPSEAGSGTVARAPRVTRDAVKEASPAELAATIRQSDAPTLVLRAELARGHESIGIQPLTAHRDASPFEALRRRAEGLDASAWVVGVGDPKALRGVLAAAKETLACVGIAAAVHVGASIEDALPPGEPPTVAVAVAASDEDAGRLVDALHDRGASQVWSQPGVDTERPDRVERLEALLDALERGAS